jgi:hypothetical protein
MLMIIYSEGNIIPMIKAFALKIVSLMTVFFSRITMYALYDEISGKQQIG